MRTITATELLEEKRWDHNDYKHGPLRISSNDEINSLFKLQTSSLMELSGPQGSGKTTVCMLAARTACRRKLKTLWFTSVATTDAFSYERYSELEDTHRTDRDYIQNTAAATLAHVVHALQKLSKQPEVASQTGLIVIDSLSSLVVTEAEGMDGEYSRDDIIRETMAWIIPYLKKIAEGLGVAIVYTSNMIPRSNEAWDLQVLVPEIGYGLWEHNVRRVMFFKQSRDSVLAYSKGGNCGSSLWASSIGSQDQQRPLTVHVGRSGLCDERAVRRRHKRRNVGVGQRGGKHADHRKCGMLPTMDTVIDKREATDENPQSHMSPHVEYRNRRNFKASKLIDEETRGAGRLPEERLISETSESGDANAGKGALTEKLDKLSANTTPKGACAHRLFQGEDASETARKRARVGQQEPHDGQEVMAEMGEAGNREKRNGSAMGTGSISSSQWDEVPL